MATNEPLNSAADEVAAAEAELKAAQEKLEAAKAKLAATTPDDACDVEKETVAAVVVDGDGRSGSRRGRGCGGRLVRCRVRG